MTGANGSTQTLIVENALNFSAALWTFTSWEATDLIRINGSGNADSITGSTRDDTIDGNGGTDTLDGANGSDTYVIDAADLPGPLTVTDSGASGTDTLRLANGISFDLVTSTLTGLEALTFTGGQTVFFGGNPLPANLAVTGVDATLQTLTIDGATTFSAALWTFTSWEQTDAISIIGTAGADTIIGSSQSDRISSNGGADQLDGKGGTDTYIFNADLPVGTVINDTGASGVDALVLSSVDVDFTAATTIAGIETIKIDGAHTATFSASQFSGNQLPANLTFLILGPGPHGITVEGASQFSAAGWTLGAWQATDIITLDGTVAADSITGSTANDTMSGAAGNDVLQGGLGDDSLDGGADNDTASYRSGAAVTVSLAIVGAQDTIGAGNDTLNLIENLIGSATGADHLTGDDNANVLTGLGGKDTLTGGLGLDTFDFNAKTESVKGANRDVILGFSGFNTPGGDLDLIDLLGIDAKKGHGNQAFHYIGAHHFHHRAGELQAKYNAVSHLAIVSGDINGDGRADFQIEVDSAFALARADFTL